ncbi:hypothetical protein GQ53DRAFT_689723 [Thozetella sp. PMI_491]|nr:hypothetical protein GQ53DRAFT_689723 [Thozetella sp. PMI_491]
MAKAKKKYRRFPDNGQCEFCPSRKWYQESGRRYCENGHQVEDWYEVDEEGGEHFGQTGHVTRLRKEVKEKKAKHLTGPIARELFLECLQVVLRKQIAWLVKVKGLPPELEVVVRDLWDLRIRNFQGVRGADKTYGTREARTGSRSLSEETLFSSQAVPEVDEEAARAKGRKVDLDWTGDDWVVPNVRETLGLCYLGCVLLREPVRIGDLYKWVRSDGMPYFGTIDLLPRHLRERLPAYGQRLLMAMPSSLDGSDIHETVTELTLGYRKNWDVVFPTLNVPQLLVLYLRDLALPPFIYTHVVQMVPLLGLEYVFPARKQEIKSYDSQKFRMLDNPDALLVACVVLATKYLCPLDSVKRYPRGRDEPLAVKMNWQVWLESFAEIHRDGRLDFEKIKSGELKVSTLTADEQEAYLDWEQNTFIKPSQGTLLEQCFPALASGSKLLPNPQQALSDYELEARLGKVMSALTFLPPKDDPDNLQNFRAAVLRMGQKHPRFKHPDALSGTMKVFYEEAASISALSLKDLTKTVHNIEQLLLQWATDVRKATGAEAEGEGEEDIPEQRSVEDVAKLNSALDSAET